MPPPFLSPHYSHNIFLSHLQTAQELLTLMSEYSQKRENIRHKNNEEEKLIDGVSWGLKKLNLGHNLITWIRQR
jgi:intein/homing endonuclease